ncbi:MAG TPA: transposase [Polyangiaceae bacterium]
MSTAIGYAPNQQKALERFLDDGRLPMSNNISERALPRQAVGRKNWIFVGSEDGALANTVFVSLIASCELHSIEPGPICATSSSFCPTGRKSASSISLRLLEADPRARRSSAAPRFPSPPQNPARVRSLNRPSTAYLRRGD